MSKKSKIRCGGLIYLMSFVLVLAVTGTASAGQLTITIDNPGFEDPVLADDDWTWLDTPGWIPGWTWVGGEGPGIWHVTSADFDPVVTPEGQNVLYTENAVGDAGGVAQVLTETFAANTDYTLTAEVGNSWYYYFAGYSVQLLAGGVVIAEDNDTLWPDYYTWATSTVEYTYDPADAALVGQPLEIRLLNLALDKDSPPAGELVGVEFDNITLSYDFDPAMAMNPSPAYGATDILRNVVLSWTPGVYAAPINGHKVYLSENFNDVNDGIGAITQSTTSYTPPQRLDFKTTYYWRVDEANSTTGWDEGDIWKFTTELLAYPIDGNNITATASSTGQLSMGPENTINGSGMDANDLHSIEPVDMWLSGDEPNGAWIEYELDKVYKLHEMWVWNSNGMMESVLGFGFKDVTIEHSTNGTDYTTLGTTHEFVRAPGTPDYAHNTTIDFSGVTAKYVRLTANSNWGGFMDQYRLSEVRFFFKPVFARKPSPDSGATDVNVDVNLGFRAGREAVTHNMYFNSDEQAVINGNAPTTMTETNYGPLSLDLGTTYYWKINEVNEAENPTTWQGDIWNFTTHEFFIVDDFEDYNDWPPDEIFSTWIDGYEILANGATAGYPEPIDFLAGEHYMETTIVYGGAQAMPFFYSNTGGATYSEAERTFAVPQDWTKAGIQTLALYLRAESLSEALDTTLSVTTDGNADWLSQTAISYYDGDAAQSGDILANQESSMRTTVSGAGTVSFYWKVSSEVNFDYLEFYIDGSMQDQISGTVDWQQMTYTITASGSHTLEWRYFKDEADIGGNDCGWVDKLEWDGGGQPPVIPGNTGQLYVKVNGVRVDYPGNVADIRWMQWNIDLASLGVDLQDVTTLAIGIEGDGASGTLYFDDFRLYRLAPEIIHR